MKPWGYWTKERVLAEALKHKDSTEWKTNCRGSYKVARTKGWLKEATSHFTPRILPKGTWTKENVLLDAKKYSKPIEWEENSPSAVIISGRNGWYEEATAHMSKGGKRPTKLFLSGKQKCYICGKVKKLECFYNLKKSKSGKGPGCKKCKRLSNAKWKLKNRDRVNKLANARRKKNPQKYRELFLKRTYGIDLKQYEDLLNEQNGVCFICLKTNNKRNLFVDHCHKTGIIRGLLCSKCNFGIGHFKDSMKIMNSAIKYIEKYANKKE